MKLAALIALLGTVVAPLASSGPADRSARAGHEVPVLAELFTSEGCSSCPPADRLLTRLLARQPIPGVRVIGLGEHVDYWNYLGWRDRFSSAAYSRRQSEYQQRVFPSNAVYTPQLVVDGHFQAVGSDAGGVRRAIERAARMPRADVDVTAGAAEAGRLPVTVRVDAGALARSGPAQILVAVVENGLVSQVARGENRGRTLKHSAVLRRLIVAGTLAAGRHAASVKTSVPIGEGWKLGRLRVVAFVQERGSRKVLGAASTVPATRSGAAAASRG
jgi:hypothetical protein